MLDRMSTTVDPTPPTDRGPGLMFAGIIPFTPHRTAVYPNRPASPVGR